MQPTTAGWPEAVEDPVLTQTAQSSPRTLPSSPGEPELLINPVIMDDRPVKIAVVVRPLLSRERIHSQHALILEWPGSVQIPALSFGGSVATETEYNFEFDRVYRMSGKEPATQLFEEMMHPALDNRFFMGVDTSVFAYGQSGAGKTCALGMGRTFAGGLFQQSISAVWDRVAALQSAAAGSVSAQVTFVELHDNQIRDLLSRHVGLGKLRESPTHGPLLERVTELRVTEVKDVLHAVSQGNTRRVSAGCTPQGQRRPSRAHAIFTLTLVQRIGGIITTSKLRFVDLAGSNGGRGKVIAGRSVGEGATISRELLALGNVISAATARDVKHVPYRDSLLTRVLKGTPGRDSESILLACLSPAVTCLEHSLQTLRFAERAQARNLPVITSAFSDEASYLRTLVAEEKLALRAASKALTLEYPSEIDPAVHTTEWQHPTAPQGTWDDVASEASQIQPPGGAPPGGTADVKWLPPSSSAHGDWSGAEHETTPPAKGNESQSRAVADRQLSGGQGRVEAGAALQKGRCEEAAWNGHNGTSTEQLPSPRQLEACPLSVKTPPQSWEPRPTHLKIRHLPNALDAPPVLHAEDRMYSSLKESIRRYEPMALKPNGADRKRTRNAE